MNESLRSRLRRVALNLHPAYWGTGARLTYLADDVREARIELPLTWRSRNAAGALSGGSVLGAVDPVYTLMLMRALGPAYRVRDTAATIRFRSPTREPLYARIRLRGRDLDAIREELATAPATERVYATALTDRDGTVHATVEKRVQIRRARAVAAAPDVAAEALRVSLPGGSVTMPAGPPQTDPPGSFRRG